MSSSDQAGMLLELGKRATSCQITSVSCFIELLVKITKINKIVYIVKQVFASGLAFSVPQYLIKWLDSAKNSMMPQRYFTGCRMLICSNKYKFKTRIPLIFVFDENKGA